MLSLWIVAYMDTANRTQHQPPMIADGTEGQTDDFPIERVIDQAHRALFRYLHGTNDDEGRARIALDLISLIVQSSRREGRGRVPSRIIR
jgi:hypothetical protein